jgi:hypothetical protein
VVTGQVTDCFGCVRSVSASSAAGKPDSCVVLCCAVLCYDFRKFDFNCNMAEARELENLQRLFRPG